jgi:DNA-binding MltR family transcriptional regulator
MDKDDERPTRGWFVESNEELAATAEMESASDRTAAIVIASLVETRLTNTLQAGLHHDDEIVERLFRPSGPLGSFSAKVDLARLMGAISQDAYCDLLIIKDVRNIFAHQLKAASFEEQRVASLCRNFRLIETMVCDMEEEAPPMKDPPFIFKTTFHRRELSTPRGRYTLTGRLFVAGLDERSAKRHTSTIYDPWI